MYDYTGWIVRSTAGHDKEDLFYVVGTQEHFLLLANGKQRKLASPKKKVRGHVVVLCKEEHETPTTQKLRQGQPVSDRELRRALAAFKGGNQLGKR